MMWCIRTYLQAYDEGSVRLLFSHSALRILMSLFSFFFSHRLLFWKDLFFISHFQLVIHRSVELWIRTAHMSDHLVPTSQEWDSKMFPVRRFRVWVCFIWSLWRYGCTFGCFRQKYYSTFTRNDSTITQRYLMELILFLGLDKNKWKYIFFQTKPHRCMSSLDLYHLKGRYVVLWKRKIRSLNTVAGSAAYKQKGKQYSCVFLKGCFFSHKHKKRL